MFIKIAYFCLGLHDWLPSSRRTEKPGSLSKTKIFLSFRLLRLIVAFQDPEPVHRPQKIRIQTTNKNHGPQEPPLHEANVF